MIKYFGVLGLSLLGGSISPYVIGYERLYNPQANVIVDILHDAHFPEHNLLKCNMEEWPFSLVKELLYQTEQRVLDALDLLNRKAPGMVDVIWEDSDIYDRMLDELLKVNHSGDESHFISGCGSQVRRQFCNLNVISSDICRAVFILLVLKRATGIEKEIDGMSLTNLVPVSDGDMATMLSMYGGETWHAFDQLRVQTVTTLAKRYGQGLSIERLNDDPDYYAALADCEMLRNILSSHKPHVILYCGGIHAKGISEFLIKHAGFKRIGGKEGLDASVVEVLKTMDSRDLSVIVKDLLKEIDTNELALLDDEFRTTAWCSTYTGSTYFAL
jgi:hypothetical protein